MQKQQAINIVRETFESSFDKGQFTNFIKNLLNEPDLSDGFGPRSGNYIPDAFKGYVDKYERLGKYEDRDDKRLDILIVYLKRETSIERARSMQRNFIAGYLQGKYGSDTEKDAALVAFVSPNGAEDWRFSLVKLEVRLEANDGGKVKVVDAFTPAKRWSFLVGRHEKSHTAQVQFVPIMQDTENNPTLETLEGAFNIEKVTKEFFEKYRALFIWTKDELDKAVKKNPKTKADFESKGIDTVNLAKKLLGQIIFLYYLQKKGWFGVPTDADWGEGSRNFLRELFEKCQTEKKNFFNDFLEPLFYEALRLDRSHDDHYYSRFDCKIPFLNGGLFDPMNNYDWVKTEILLSNDLFSNKKKLNEVDTGDGILDIFDRYNFTVKEDEPFEKEVAIDPELLGKAYEKFNAIRPDNYDEFLKALKSGKKGDESKFNKQFGVYYTPREIVHYMCQQSLINYLYSELNPHTAHQALGDQKLDMFGNAVKTGQYDLTVEQPIEEFSKKDIALLIQHGENWRENEARVDAAGKETETYSYKMPESIRLNAALIDEKLANIKVCDPAVGSGAFPVGMMSEIVKARGALTTYLTTKDTKGTKGKGKSNYDFKRECIENSLYGVDIDSGAVEIAKLRLWLSLVVDEDDPQNIKPLPNLDYKIVRGNSLIGVEKNLFNVNLFTELESLKPLYFNVTNPAKKQEYKKKIDSLIDQITNGRAQFDFEIYFSEVFHEKEGFDVVIGNPPYIEFKKVDQQTKKLYAQFETAKGKYDVYLLFIEISFRILRDIGFFCFINPNTFMKKDYGEAARKFILRNFQIEKIHDFGDIQVFESAMNYTGIFMFLASRKKSTYGFEYHQYKNTGRAIASQELSESLNSVDFLKNILVVSSDKLSNDIWNFQNNFNTMLLDKIVSRSKPFSEYASSIFEGIASGKDDVFYVTNDVIQEYKVEKGVIFPLLRGKDVKPYAITWEKMFVIYPYDENSKPFDEKTLSSQFPNVYSYLKKNRKLLSGRGYFESSGKYWYELWNQRKRTNFNKLRIITPEIANKNSFALTDKHFGNTKTYHIVLLDESKENYYFFLGMLNSKLLDYIYKLTTTHHAGGYFAYKTHFLEKIPISNKIVVFDKKPFINLVERVLAAKRVNPRADTSKLEEEIDALVYQLYGLTEEEIRIVEGK